jgi:hypothetical protein
MAWCLHDWETVRSFTHDNVGNAALDRIDGGKRMSGVIQRSRDSQDHVDRVCLKCGAVDIGIERAIQQRQMLYVEMDRRKAAAAEIYKRITGESVDGKTLQPPANQH